MDTQSSQAGPSRALKPQIFCGLDLFIDPTGIAERPALVRRLKAHGASKPCSNPRDAEILLVNTSSASGRRFIRDWGNDPSKVVLAVAWAEDCIKQGKPLLLAEGWGNHVAVDDGLPIVEGDPELGRTEEDTAHLPTPRQTPKESITKAQLQPAPTKTAETNGSESSAKAEQVKPAFEPTPKQLETENTPLATPAPTTHTDHNTAQITNQAQQLPPPLSPPMVFAGPPGAYPQQMYLQQQPIGALGGYPMLPYNVAMGQEHYNPSLMPQVTYAQHPQFHSPFSYQMPNGTVTTAYSLSGGYPPHQASSPVPTQSPNGMDVDIISPPPPTRRLDSEPPALNNGYDETNSFAKAYTSMQSNFPTKDKSHRRKSSSRRRQPTPTPEPTSESEESSGVELPIPPSQRSQPSSSSNSRSGWKIFVHNDGSPIQFFVMVTMYGRRADLIQKIKKCGGSVTSDIAVADYAVLRNDGKIEFRTHYSQCLTAGTPAVHPKFIDDCIDEGRVLETDDYGFETTNLGPVKRRREQISPAKREIASPKRRLKQPEESSPRRKKRYSTAGTITPVQKFSPEPTQKPLPKRKRARETSPAADTEAQPEIKTEVSPDPKSEPRSTLTRNVDHRPSPPPPPIHTRKEYSQGRWYYTAEDMQCAKEYIQVLLERDPDISACNLANKLHEKMPHHSQKSWAAQLNKDKIDLDGMRAIVERRLRLYGNTLGKSGVKEEWVDPPTISQTVSVNKPRRGNQERLAAEDFEFILDFFKAGGADDPDDTKVWANLTAKRPCYSAQDWPSFYERNREAIDSLLVAHYTAQTQQQKGEAG